MEVSVSPVCVHGDFWATVVQSWFLANKQPLYCLHSSLIGWKLSGGWKHTFMCLYALSVFLWIKSNFIRRPSISAIACGNKETFSAHICQFLHQLSVNVPSQVNRLRSHNLNVWMDVRMANLKLEILRLGIMFRLAHASSIFMWIYSLYSMRGTEWHH